MRILNAFVKPSEPCSMEQHGARFSEFAGIFQVKIQSLVYFAVDYKYTKSRKRGKNFPQDFFIISLGKM